MKTIFLQAICLLTLHHSFSQTERITFNAPMVYPEGVVWSLQNNCFYVSSATKGTIGAVTPSGDYTVFYSDTSLKSTFGMKIDEAQNTLWVATGDPNYSKFSTLLTYRKMARVMAIDLKTHQKKADIDLSSLYAGDHFINDLTMDNEGNIYATDSYSPAIYKIDKSGKASLFAKSDLFSGSDVALNGIVYVPEGFLIVANDASGSLLKVNIKDPQQSTKIKLEGFYPGVDGLLLENSGSLLAVQNKGVDKITRFNSKDHWNSAIAVASTSSEDRFQNPSTITMNKSGIYALNAKLNELSDSIKNPSKEFSLQKVVLKNN